MAIEPSPQFEQHMLPGMPLKRNLPRRTPTVPFNDEAGRKWTGPIPGQLAMGVHSLGGDALGHVSRGRHQEPFYEADDTGMFNELGDSGRQGVPSLMREVSPVDIEAKHNVRRTVNYYKTYGGAHADKPHVQEHWASQPRHEIPSNAIVHTGQDWRETLWGDSKHDVMAGHVEEKDAEGRQRINGIRQSLQMGDEIQNPAWLIKRSGRLYAMDGHHRIAAAREEGKATFPAHVWDLDAEEAHEKAQDQHVTFGKPMASPKEIQERLAAARAERAQRQGRAAG